MEYKYLITDIQAKTNVSITSLTAFKKKHQDFFNNNSTRKHRKIYYNQAAMDFFISYYSPDTDTDKKIPDKIIDTETGGGKAENPLSETSSKEEEFKTRIDALQTKIDALHAEIDILRRQLEEKEEERKELIRQNGALILTLQQEKQEKQLFLPAPKKTLGEKIKGIFKSNS